MQAIRDYSTFMPVMSGTRFGDPLFQRSGLPIGWSGNVPFDTNMDAVLFDQTPGDRVQGMAGALGLPVPEIGGTVGIGVESFPSLSVADLDPVLPEDWQNSRLGDIFKKFAVYFFALLFVGLGVLFFVGRPSVIKAAAKAAV